MPLKGGYWLPAILYICFTLIKVNQTSKYQIVSETKELRLNTFKCLSFYMIRRKITFNPPKITKKNAKFL